MKRHLQHYLRRHPRLKRALLACLRRYWRGRERCQVLYWRGKERLRGRCQRLWRLLRSSSPLERANRLTAAGDWRRATRVWRRLTRRAEVPPALAWVEYGRCLLHRGRADKAAAALHRALRLRSDYALAWNLLAWAAMEREDWLEAAKAWSEYGRGHLHGGRLDEAAVALDRALQCEPDYAAAWILTGWVAAEQGDWPAAAAAYRDALHLELPPPQRVDTMLALAYAMMKDEAQCPAALDVVEEADKFRERRGLEGAACACVAARAWCLLKLRREDEAIEIMEGDGVDCPAPHPSFRIAYIKAFRRPEKRAAARLFASYESGFLRGEASPHDLRAVEILMHGGRFEEARRVYARVFEVCAAHRRFPQLLRYVAALFHGADREYWFGKIRERAGAMLAEGGEGVGAREAGGEDKPPAAADEVGEGEPAATARDEVGEAPPRHSRESGNPDKQQADERDAREGKPPAAARDATKAMLGALYGLRDEAGFGRAARRFHCRFPQEAAGALACHARMREAAAAHAARPARADSPPARARQKVFCIGLTRTATTSLHEALALLGLTAAHFTNPYSGELLGERDLALFDALSDTPIAWRFEALHERYPDACFIYTTRPVEEWAASLLRHIHWWHGARDYAEFRRLLQGGGGGNNSGGNGGDNDFAHGEPLRAIYRGLYAAHETPQAAYQAHDRRVRAFFAARPEAKFLEMNIFAGDGWEKLANFLGLPAPEGDFPFINQGLELNEDGDAPSVIPASLGSKTGGIQKKSQREAPPVLDSRFRGHGDNA